MSERDSSDEPSTSTRITSNQDQSETSTPSLARSETRRVKRSKLLVFLVIVVCAIGAAIATYFFTTAEETSNFESEFNGMAVEIIDVSHYEAESIFRVVDNFATDIVSFVKATSMAWPLVTIPDFELRGFKSNRVTKALQLSLVPLVKEEELVNWEQYAVTNQEWIEDGLKVQEDFNITRNPEDGTAWQLETGMSPFLWRLDGGDKGSPLRQKESGIDFGPGEFAPVWQQSPAPHDATIVNFDLLSHPTFSRIYHGMWESRLPVISEVTDLSFLYGGAIKNDITHPHSFLLQPIYPELKSDLPDRNAVVGFVTAVLPWDSYFTRLLSEGKNGLVVVLHNNCGESYTYQINGPEALYLGKGDLHDTRYDELGLVSDFAPFLKNNFSDTHEHCEYDVRVYPSKELEDQYTTHRPILYTIVVLFIFVCTATVFLVYDYMVQVRQDKVMATALRTNAVVDSIFPTNVRDRIVKDAAQQAEEDLKAKRRLGGGVAKAQLRDFLNEDIGEENKDIKAYDTKPIADLFPFCTIMFADLVGFTAWSSVREPCQVFTLLETLFHAFDEIASLRRVFKVETVGDCYVAVAGLPEPRKDHATVMARFARDCLYKTNELVKKLECTLGPDTADLCMRIGLHSGPVTAGVLRGDKSRFQLFGDTVNTCSRIESLGEKNQIHVSTETATLLQEAGKAHWLTPRENIVQAKGKGEMKTFWLNITKPKKDSCYSGSTRSHSRSSDELEDTSANVHVAAESELDGKTMRLVEWNSDILSRLLRQIMARRNALVKLGKLDLDNIAPPIFSSRRSGAMVLDEVKEIIELPEFDAEAAKSQEDPENIVIDDVVLKQLKDLVVSIASMYRQNPFHNFEHASHVTMSVVKLLSRIVAPEIDAVEGSMDAHLHDHTYGITSDPLTQFACVFAALIHDVDHSGVPNAQLVQEKAHVATVYNGKSVAEQNSVDLSWNLLMDPAFAQLRLALCPTEHELRHFRGLVVNGVMATDIVDKDLKGLRNARWDKAFKETTNSETTTENVNRKATIVIEHLIQASDIAHTMQHWHVYRKWNERLFHEMYDAYKKGRSDRDPSEFWYKGEIGFFDFYILPLASKLKDCGVFGVSSDEYLNYAEKNRDEWESCGEAVVETLVEKYTKMYASTEVDAEED